MNAPVTPPGLRSPDLERAVLGSVLICAACGDDLFAELSLTPEDFAQERHRALWLQLQARHAAGAALDLLSLGDAWNASGNMAAACAPFGGFAYVQSHDVYAEPATAQLHARRLREYTRRRMARLALAQAQSSMAPDTDADEMVRLALDALHTASASVDTVASVGELVEAMWGRVTEEATGGRSAFVPTGIPEWDSDEDFLGLSTEGVTLILAASGMGKTSVLNRLALSLAATGRKVYLHGTETSALRRVKDLAYSLAGVDAREWASRTRQVAQGRVGAEDAVHAMMACLGDAADDIAAMGLEITGGGMTAEEVCQRARVLHRRGQCDVVLVDYLQDLKHTRAPGLDLAKGPQTTYASGRLKDLAAELDVPVVVGGQVSGEKAGPAQDPRPHMWDCQWSSGAHQDAEEVYTLYREDYYVQRFGAAWKDRGGRPGHVEVIARKRRVGKLGTLNLRFDGPSKWVGRR